MLKTGNPRRSRNVTNIPKIQYNAEVPSALSKALEILPQNQNVGWDSSTFLQKKIKMHKAFN